MFLQKAEKVLRVNDEWAWAVHKEYVDGNYNTAYGVYFQNPNELVFMRRPHADKFTTMMIEGYGADLNAFRIFTRWNGPEDESIIEEFV